MIKIIKHLLKSLLASNLALAMVAMPGSLIIPQDQLDSAFNVSANISSVNRIQTPVEFTYMSTGFSSYHPGIDFATKHGTKILPIEPGTVIEAGFSPFGYGNVVVIDNGNGAESLYAHLSKIKVKKGEVVDTNTEIGQVGSTGHSTGPHLHLEVHKDGKSINPLSVLPHLTDRRITLIQQ